MADQNRWNQDRERAGRFSSDDRSRRGYEGRRDYGADDWRSGGYGYGRRDVGTDRLAGDYGYAPEDRTFDDVPSGAWRQGEPRHGGWRPTRYDAGLWRGASRYDPQDRTWMERAGERVGRFFEEVRERSHRGKGPKGYTRSDDRVREDVNDRLTDDHWLDATDVEVQVTGCEVTLTGTVANRDDRRRAEDIAEQVSGVKHVQNNLRVQEQAGTSTFATAGPTTGTAAETPAGRTGSTRLS